MRATLMSAIILIAITGVATANPGGKRRADRDLNSVYSELATRLETTGKTQLKITQRAWIAFRNEECRYRQANFANMTSQSDCETALTIARTKELRTQLAWLAPMDNRGKPGQPDVQKSCAQVMGKAKANRLVQQCLTVSPATRPPCNAVNRCDLISGEIERGCDLLGANAPTFCND